MAGLLPSASVNNYLAGGVGGGQAGRVWALVRRDSERPDGAHIRRTTARVRPPSRVLAAAFGIHRDLRASIHDVAVLASQTARARDAYAR